MNKNNRKLKIDDKIQMMAGRSCPCRVKLPPGMVCMYRAHTLSELKPHEISHERAIADNNRKSKARDYEKCIEYDATDMIEVIEELEITDVVENLAENVDAVVEVIEYSDDQITENLQIEPDLNANLKTKIQILSKENGQISYELKKTKQELKNLISNFKQIRTENNSLKSQIDICIKEDEENKNTIARLKQENQVLQSRLTQLQHTDYTPTTSSAISSMRGIIEKLGLPVELNSSETRLENSADSTSIEQVTVQQQTAASISPLHHVNPYDNAHQNMVTTTDCNQSQLMTIHNSDQALNDVAIEEAEDESTDMNTENLQPGNNKVDINDSSVLNIEPYLSNTKASTNVPGAFDQVGMDATQPQKIQQTQAISANDSDMVSSTSTLSSTDDVFGFVFDYISTQSQTFGTRFDSNLCLTPTIPTNQRQATKSAFGSPVTNVFACESASVLATAPITSRSQLDAIAIDTSFMKAAKPFKLDPITDTLDRSNVLTSNGYNSLDDNALNRSRQCPQISPAIAIDDKINRLPNSPPPSPDSQSENLAENTPEINKDEIVINDYQSDITSKNEAESVTLQDAMPHTSPPILQRVFETVSSDPIDETPPSSVITQGTITPIKERPFFAEFSSPNSESNSVRKTAAPTYFNDLSDSTKYTKLPVVLNTLQDESNVLTNKGYESSPNRYYSKTLKEMLPRNSRKRISCDQISEGEQKTRKKTRTATATETTIETTTSTFSSDFSSPAPQQLTSSARSSVSETTKKSLDMLTQQLAQQVMEKRDQIARQKSGQQEEKKRKLFHEPNSKLKFKSVPRVKTSVKKCAKEAIVQGNSKEKGSELNKIPRDFGSLAIEPLEAYDLPRKIIRIENEGDKSYFNVLDELMKNSATNASQYVEAYTSLLNLEEAAETLDLERYDQKSLQLVYSNSGKKFQIRKDAKTVQIQQGIDESLLDKFELRSTSLNCVVHGQIKGDDKKLIFVEISDKDFPIFKQSCHKQYFDIHFKVNTLPYRIQHKMLKYFEMFRLHSILIANPKYNCVEEYSALDHTHYKFRGILSRDLNTEQKIAVISILTMQKSVPFLLFGPAGTGKTRTLVAAIEEIVQTSSNFVLVCANSNSAADEITQRLSKILQPNEFLRIFAKSFTKSKLKEDTKKSSNFVNGEFKFPCFRYIYKFKVVICTLSTAGHLMRARNRDKSFDAHHFSYLIIDESASTTETATLIPIAGLCSSDRGVHAKIILAGDPKQLDAVCKSNNASKLGFNISLMERLFALPLYMDDPETKDFNTKFIIQLIDNYRSHASILHVANRLFYNGTLLCKGPPEIINWFVDSEFTPNNVPIMFQAVFGISSQVENDRSLFNMKEVHAVIKLIKSLVGSVVNNREVACSDIGIVSPYKLQCKILIQYCQRLNYTDITIGTAEVFQGQEKRIMIVSTVRTGGVLGFVKCHRRINVVLTRAQSLLVIIGDPETLYKDTNWRYLLDVCRINLSFIQSEEKTFEFPYPILEELEYNKDGQ